jgi:hypothetical protein
MFEDEETILGSCECTGMVERKVGLKVYLLVKGRLMIGWMLGKDERRFIERREITQLYCWLT